MPLPERPCLRRGDHVAHDWDDVSPWDSAMWRSFRCPGIGIRECFTCGGTGSVPLEAQEVPTED